MSLSEAKVTEWFEAYGKAWREREPEAVIGLFTEDAHYYETPFDEPAVGHAGIRKYWSQIPATQKNITFGYEIVALVGPCCLARWWATFDRTTREEQVELDGFFQLRFNDDHKCVDLREWWHWRAKPISG